MEPKEIKEIVDVLIKGANGEIPNFKEEEAIAFEKKAIEIISQTSNDLIIAKLSPITNMNILRMNVHFFDNLPKIWGCIQNAAEISVREA
jgi:hypothetical protein